MTSPPPIQNTSPARPVAAKELKVTLWGLGLAAVAILLLLVYMLWSAREADLQHARITTLNQARSLAGRMEVVFQRMDGELHNLVQTIPPDALDPAHGSRHERDVALQLSQAMQNFPEVNAFRVADAEGRLLYAFDGKTTRNGQPVDFSDRAWFRQVRGEAGNSLVYSEVITERVTGSQAIVIARALRTRAGRFNGAVVATFAMDVLQNEFRKLDIGPGASVVLRRSDTTALLVRWPHLPTEINKTLPPENITARKVAAGEKEFNVHSAGGTDGKIRIGGTRVVQGYPFFVAAGFSEAEVLRDWRRDALITVTSGVLLTLLLLSLMWRLWHSDLARGRAESRLEDSEQYSRKIVDNLAEGVLTVDTNGRIASANPAATRLFGYPPHGLSGKPLSSLLPDCTPAMLAASAGNPTAPLAVTGMGKDGQKRFMELALTHSAYADHWQTIALIRDVTDHHEKDRFIRSITDALPTTIAYWSPNLICAFASRAFGPVFGFDPEQMVGRHHREIFGDARHEKQQPYLQGALRGQPQQFETSVPQANGALTHLQVRYLPDMEGGILRGFFGIGWDITEAKTAQLVLEQMNLDLQERTRQAESSTLAKSRFLGTMSHELRTPLNGILGMAQLLKLETTRAEDRAGFVDDILSSGQSLLALLNDLLDVSRIESGNLRLAVAPFSPSEVVDAVLSLTAVSANGKGLQLAYAGPVHERKFLGDAGRIRQMLLNLVSNAIKFTDRGSVTVDISITDTAPAQSVLEMRVTDTGIGIPDDKLHLLFQPFSQIDDSSTRSHGGTGLGLSIVRLLAERMDGSVGVDSQPGRGSCFWFRVSLQRVADGSTETVPAGNSPPQTTIPATAQRRILIVDDSPLNATVLSVYLQTLGHAPENVPNGEACVKRVTERGDIDLVLMDCHMPVMDGFEATRQIRARRAANAPYLPIIAITALAYDEDRERCLAAGMDEVLIKPVDLDQIQAVVSRWLR